MSLSPVDRIEVYKYTLDYEYTGHSAPSLQKAVEIGAKYTGVHRVITSGGTHRGFRYSSMSPILDSQSGKMVLPLEGRIQNPLQGTGSQYFEPLKVTRDNSGGVQYFVGLRRAVTIIREGTL